MSCILFNFRNKFDVSIHYSWISSIVLAIVRLTSLIIIATRYALYVNSTNTLCAYDFKYLTFYGFVISLIYFILVFADLILSKTLLKNME